MSLSNEAINETEQPHAQTTQSTHDPSFSDHSRPFSYSHPSLNATLPPPTAPLAAAQEIVRWNSTPPSSSHLKSAITRLRDVVYDIRAGKEWSPELMTLIFPDLDLVFFGGKLSMNVNANWATNEFWPGMQDHYGLTFRWPENRQHAVILLSLKNILRGEGRDCGSFARLWETVLHEMW